MVGGVSNFGTITGFAFSGGRTTAPLAAGAAGAAGALVSVVDVVSVPGGFAAGVEATSAGDGTGVAGDGAGVAPLDCAQADAAQSMTTVKVSSVLFIMIFRVNGSIAVSLDH